MQASSQQEACGRNRRRKGFINRLRRWGYGLLLAVTAHGTAAADKRAHDNSREPVSQIQLSGTGDHTGSNPVFLARVASDNFEETVVHGSLLAHATTPAPAMPWYSPDPVSYSLAIAFAHNDLADIRNGARLDIQLPEIGKFHLDLYSKPNARRQGKRWSFTPAGIEDTTSMITGGDAWSLGASVKMLRTPHGRDLSFNPQLVLDLNKLIGAPGKFDAAIQYAPWINQHGIATGERVPQIRFNWRF